MAENETTACPRCGGAAAPVLYGLPGPEMFEAAERGEIVLGGCEVGPERWWCGTCARYLPFPEEAAAERD
ncbi:hypothetical protein GCM10023085_47050 [Actinomadura viridis]|uniref:Uncharacterized protein n=1 Tax=Actinomadura viridis TaxID=58110 RepID=A0A931DNF7_9ACTN|nr:hypothetical protein [Actinomadura viridis]MBG6090791.1 hypothetical protein [Actinomadura viridis]